MVPFKSTAQCARLCSMSEWTTLREPIKLTQDADCLLIVRKFKIRNKRSVLVCIAAESVTK